MLQVFISSLLLEIDPPSLAIPRIAKGTIYMNPLRMALGRYPVMTELKPGLHSNQESNNNERSTIICNVMRLKMLDLEPKPFVV